MSWQRPGPDKGLSVSTPWWKRVVSLLRLLNYLMYSISAWDLKSCLSCWKYSSFSTYYYKAVRQVLETGPVRLLKIKWKKKRSSRMHIQWVLCAKSYCKTVLSLFDYNLCMLPCSFNSVGVNHHRITHTDSQKFSFGAIVPQDTFPKFDIFLPACVSKRLVCSIVSCWSKGIFCGWHLWSIFLISWWYQHPRYAENDTGWRLRSSKLWGSKIGHTCRKLWSRVPMLWEVCLRLLMHFLLPLYKRFTALVSIAVPKAIQADHNSSRQHLKEWFSDCFRGYVVDVRPSGIMAMSVLWALFEGAIFWPFQGLWCG